MSRGLYIAGSLLCFGGAAALYMHSRKQMRESTPAPSEQAEKKPADAPAPQKPAPAPVKQVEGDATGLMKVDPDAILGKTIIAKNDGSAIYTTTFKEAGRTKKREILGKPFKHTVTSNGTYNLKYQDANGNFRIINSSAVLAQL